MNASAVADYSYAKAETQVAEILVVDDEPTILQSLSKILSHHYKDLRILTAASAEEALDMLETSEVKLVVTDLRLPKMDGLALARRVKEQSPETAAILMTAFGDDSILQEANEIGCLAYIEKPFDVDQLIEHVETALHPVGRMHVELTNLSVLDVIELYTTKKRNAVLSLMSDDSAGLLVIRDGILSHAQWNNLDGADALMQILECQDGHVSSVSCEIPSRQTLKLDWNSLERALQFHGARERAALMRTSSTLRPESPRYGLRSVNGPRENILSTFLSQSSAVSESSVVKPKVIEEVAQPEPPPPPELRKERWAEDLILAPEPPPAPAVAIPTKRQAREQKIRLWLDKGIKAFSAHNLEEAREAWMIVLRLDPECHAARKNLEILEQFLKKKEQMI